MTALLPTNILGGEPLGMENGTIPDENITASSSASAAPPHLGRLNGAASWCTGKADGCYLQVRLTSIVKSHYLSSNAACPLTSAHQGLSEVVIFCSDLSGD